MRAMRLFDQSARDQRKFCLKRGDDMAWIFVGFSAIVDAYEGFEPAALGVVADIGHLKFIGMHNETSFCSGLFQGLWITVWINMKP